MRVVVADNDEDALDLAATDLALEGHQVVGCARNGEDAVDLVRRLRPDVLIVDYRMPPGPNGVDVARRLSDVPGLRIVLYTNYRSAALRRATDSAGAVFLSKGSLGALRAAVRGAA